MGEFIKRSSIIPLVVILLILMTFYLDYVLILLLWRKLTLVTLSWHRLDVDINVVIFKKM